MGKPAARLGDNHVCPMVTGVVPHVGGPILPVCQPNVLIGGKPAARIGDKLVCVGPPDTIIQGEPTVLIGNKPAARIGDATMHGGKIVLGEFTVLIGGDNSVTLPTSSVAMSGAGKNGTQKASPKKSGDAATSAPSQSSQSSSSAAAKSPSNAASAQSRDDEDKCYCDIKSITLLDTVSGRRVTTSMPVARQVSRELPAGAPTQNKSLYKGHDFILELVSSPHAEDDAKAVKLQITAEYVGKCKKGEHPALSMMPSRIDLDTPQMWPTGTPAELELFAVQGPGDRGAKAVGFGSKWISPFWFFASNIKEFQIMGFSCGARHQGDPNRTLRGIVRVYRDDVYTLQCKIPALGSYKKEMKGTWDAKGTHAQSSSSSTSVLGQQHSGSSQSTKTNSKTGEVTKETTRTYRDGGRTHGEKSEETINQANGTISSNYTISETRGIPGLYQNNRELEETDSTTGAPKLIDDKEVTFEPAISLKRNGHEVEFTKFINDILNLQKRILDAWNEIKNWVPKVGWSVDFSLSILEGTISGEWGYRAVTAGGSERALWVDRFYNFNFDCKLVDYKLELSFGIEISTPDDLLAWFGVAKAFELIIKAAGEITGAINLHATLAGTDISKPTKIEGDTNVDIYVQAKVTALGVVYEAKGGITGGIAVNGVLNASFDKEPNMDIRAYSKETKVYAYFVNEKKKNRKSKEYSTTIWDEKTIWEGQLFSSSEQSAVKIP